MDSRPAGDHGEVYGGACSVMYATEPRERFERPDEYVSYAVCDPLGKKVGSVERLFMNGGGEPEYIRIKMGLLGLKSVLCSPCSAQERLRNIRWVDRSR